MLEVLQVCLLSAHLLCANAGSAVPLLCVAIQFHLAVRHNKAEDQIGRRLAFLSLQLLLVAMLLGLLAAGLMWFTGQLRFFQTAMRIPTRIGFSIVEFVFSLTLLALYGWHWSLGHGPNLLKRIGMRLMAIIASTNLLYHFPILFIALNSISDQDYGQSPTIGRSVFREWLADGYVIALSVHVCIACFAVAGLALSIVAFRSRNESCNSDDEGVWRRLVICGARVCLASTLLQIPVGVWLITQLPQPAQLSVLGHDLPGTIMLGLSILLTVVLLHHLATLSAGEVDQASLLICVLLMVLVVGLMSGTLRRSRVCGGMPLDVTVSEGRVSAQHD